VVVVAVGLVRLSEAAITTITTTPVIVAAPTATTPKTPQLVVPTAS